MRGVTQAVDKYQGNHCIGSICRARRVLSALLLVTAFFIFWGASVGSAHAWWNEKWKHRKRIVIDCSSITPQQSSNLVEIPILIRLHSGNFDFTAAKDDGSDIRFVSPDEKQVLPYQIEAYDPLEEVAFIWVKVPSLSIGSKENSIWLYYGNSEAGNGQSPGETFRSSYSLVYHFSEEDGPPLDQTPNRINAGLALFGHVPSSIIGPGASFNGVDERIVIPATPLLDFSSGFTFSAWIRSSDGQEDGYIFSRQEQGQSIVLGIEGNSLYLSATDQEGNSYATDKSAQITPESWHLVSVAVGPAGKGILFLDGKMAGSIDMPVPAQVSGDIVLGGDGAGEHLFAGEMDEVRFSSLVRPAEWIQVRFAAEGPDGGGFILFAPEEKSGGSWFSDSDTITYLRIVFGNVTLDGWIIIVSLILMGMGCSVIFVYKLFLFKRISEDNRRFIEVYLKELRPCQLYKKRGVEFGSSTLFRIYREACSAMDGGNGNNGPASSKKVMSKVRAAMEKAYIDNSKEITSWLVFLTLAIAGAPAMGLLGTVWGVMNTFAAMAEAGEANIMAIAPGVASALATTVVGLIVAIPSLFAYNYLSNRTSNMSTDMAVFMENLTAALEEVAEEDE